MYGRGSHKSLLPSQELEEREFASQDEVYQTENPGNKHN
jgi:hypothetical protein